MSQLALFALCPATILADLEEREDTQPVEVFEACLALEQDTTLRFAEPTPTGGNVYPPIFDYFDVEFDIAPSIEGEYSNLLSYWQDNTSMMDVQIFSYPTSQRLLNILNSEPDLAAVAKYIAADWEVDEAALLLGLQNLIFALGKVTPQKCLLFFIA
ncbi:hypothetical protein LJC61_01370 [Ruminococcaceae bacterium OttesenSCG-928-A16]|nr:hypothetical protein [Ruminococcaceae bacterium OttesenSCG-928-A16]